MSAKARRMNDSNDDKERATGGGKNDKGVEDGDDAELWDGQGQGEQGDILLWCGWGDICQVHSGSQTEKDQIKLLQ